MGGGQVALGDRPKDLLASRLGQPAQRRPRPVGGQQGVPERIEDRRGSHQLFEAVIERASDALVVRGAVLA